MRKIIVLNRVSLDGFFTGPKGEIDWFIPDPEVDKAAHGAPSSSGQPNALLLGRVTYDMFVHYWPFVAKDPHAPEGARTTANELSQMTKVVFSRTLEASAWENTVLVKDHMIQKVREMKQQPGSDILIFGSGTIVQQLAKAALIDDYLIVLTPVILGAGKPMFADVQKTSLRLVDAKSFSSGNVLLHYTA